MIAGIRDDKKELGKKIIYIITYLCGFMRERERERERESDLSSIWKVYFLSIYFTIQLIFITIHEFHCTFWYYLWVSLYYFS